MVDVLSLKYSKQSKLTFPTFSTALHEVYTQARDVIARVSLFYDND